MKYAAIILLSALITANIFSISRLLNVENGNFILYYYNYKEGNYIANYAVSHNIHTSYYDMNYEQNTQIHLCEQNKYGYYDYDRLVCDINPRIVYSAFIFIICALKFYIGYIVFMQEKNIDNNVDANNIV